MPSATFTAKILPDGTFVIPKEIRGRLGLRESDDVIVTITKRSEPAESHKPPLLSLEKAKEG